MESYYLVLRISFQRTLFLPQLLIGQEPLSYQHLVTTEAFEADVPFSDLEKLENDIENMLKVVEKHLESSNEDEKVGSEFSKPECSYFSSLLIIFLHHWCLPKYLPNMIEQSKYDFLMSANVSDLCNA